MNPRPGEVWQADLGLSAKNRPVVIVSRFDPDAPRALAIYVPLTSQNRGSQYEVALPRLPFLSECSTANTQGVSAIKLVRLERRLGKLSDDVFQKIKQALSFALDLK